jgi:PQQ-dependent catabolism-associated beta-propeller protein
MLRVLAILLAALPAAAGAETIYVSNEESNVVHVIDGATLKETGRLDVGKRSRGIALSPDGKLLYVAVSNDDKILVFDRSTGKRVGALPSGPDPETFALSPDGKRMFVANENDGVLSIVDVPSAKALAQAPVGGEPEGTAVSPDNRIVVQTSETASSASVIDAATGKLIDTFLVDSRPRYVAFTPDGKQFWIASEVRGTVTAFDAATLKRIGHVDFQDAGIKEPVVQAVGIAFTRDGRRAFVALGRGRHVAEVDPKSFRIVRLFPVGYRAWNLALSPDEKRLYTANGLTGDMSAIDIVANKPIGTVALGGKPWGIVAAP